MHAACKIKAFDGLEENCQIILADGVTSEVFNQHITDVRLCDFVFLRALVSTWENLPQNNYNQTGLPLCVHCVYEQNIGGYRRSGELPLEKQSDRMSLLHVCIIDCYYCTLHPLTERHPSAHGVIETVGEGEGSVTDVAIIRR